MDLWVRKISWRREWQPSPVFLPGKLHGPKNSMGYSPWGCKESDTTERLTVSLSHSYSYLITYNCIYIYLITSLYKYIEIYVYTHIYIYKLHLCICFSISQTLFLSLSPLRKTLPGGKFCGQILLRGLDLTFL